MFRAATFALALLAPTMGHALCNGPSFWDSLSADQQRELQASVGDIPYAGGNTWFATKGDDVLTIVGTLHLPDARHDVTMDRIREALLSADVVLVEATLDDQKDMQTHLARNPDLLTLPSDMSLPDILGDETWAALRDAAAARGLPGAMAARMQPWFLAMTLAIPSCAMGSMVEGGLDNIIMREAGDLGIPVEPLEPWQDMFDLLAGGTFEEQLDALRMSVIDPAIQDAMVVALVDFYFAEQTAMGWNIGYYTKDFLPPEIATTFDAEMAELEKTLLTDRNIKWIPVITQATQTHDDIFIAFGAAHLFGEFGVLNLLAQDGWDITFF